MHTLTLRCTAHHTARRRCGEKGPTRGGQQQNAVTRQPAQSQARSTTSPIRLLSCGQITGAPYAALSFSSFSLSLSLLLSVPCAGARSAWLPKHENPNLHSQSDVGGERSWRRTAGRQGGTRVCFLVFPSGAQTRANSAGTGALGVWATICMPTVPVWAQYATPIMAPTPPARVTPPQGRSHTARHYHQLAHLASRRAIVVCGRACVFAFALTPIRPAPRPRHRHTITTTIARVHAGNEANADP